MPRRIRSAGRQGVLILALTVLSGAVRAQPAATTDPALLTRLHEAGRSIALATICHVTSQRIVLVAQKIMQDAGRNLTEKQAADATRALNAGVADGQRQIFPGGKPPCDQIELDFTLLAAKSGVPLQAWQSAGQASR